MIERQPWPTSLANRKTPVNAYRKKYFAKITGMSKSDQMLAERLREARELAGYESASEAARALGVPLGTYGCHENGVRGFKRDRALRYAKFFKVDPQWLLYGIGNPRGPDLIDKLKALNDDNQRYVIKQIDTLLAQEAAERDRTRR